MVMKLYKTPNETIIGLKSFNHLSEMVKQNKMENVVLFVDNSDFITQKTITKLTKSLSKHHIKFSIHDFSTNIRKIDQSNDLVIIYGNSRIQNYGKILCGNLPILTIDINPNELYGLCKYSLDDNKIIDTKIIPFVCSNNITGPKQIKIDAKTLSFHLFNVFVHYFNNVNPLIKANLMGVVKNLIELLKNKTDSAKNKLLKLSYINAMSYNALNNIELTKFDKFLASCSVDIKEWENICCYLLPKVFNIIKNKYRTELNSLLIKTNTDLDSLSRVVEWINKNHYNILSIIDKIQSLTDNQIINLLEWGK